MDRENEKLPSTSEVNPKQAMSISLRSGKELDEPKVVVKAPKDKGKEVIVEAGVKGKEMIVREKLPSSQNEKVKPYVPLIPFPQRLKKQSKEKAFLKYLDMFKKIQINISFIEAISPMPHYAKFLKEICFKSEEA